MTEKGRKILIQNNATALAILLQHRLDSVKAAAAVPDACGPDIAPAPARGGFVLVQNIELIPVGTDDVEAVHRGYGGRQAIRRADAFDAMLAAAARRKQPAPLTHGQISIGRRYHDLVQLLSADGTKLSSLQASAGGPDGRDWMDRRLEVSAEVDRLRQRLGSGAALVLRRVRPSQRGRALEPGERGPLTFTSRDLVDCVCLRGMSIKQVLRLFQWTDSGRNCNAAIAALGEALEAMMGYRGRKSS